MKWTELSIFTSFEGTEAVCGRLDTLGVRETMIVQGREETERILRDTAKYWDFADMDEICAGEPCVTAYIASAPGNDSLIERIRESFARLKTEDVGLDMGSLRMVSRTVDDEDWANSWKKSYKPLPIGERLLIRPSWEEDYDPGERTVLSIDPGMAFGTGTHETTRMCLEAVERCELKGVHALDLGCGSGILAISALLLGAEDALLVDIDPITSSIVCENAALNGIGEDRCKIIIGDALSDEAIRNEVLSRKYGLITANIVASVIIALAPVVAGSLGSGGTFICSGIIAERLDEVVSALEQNGLCAADIYADGEWREITAKLK